MLVLQVRERPNKRDVEMKDDLIQYLISSAIELVDVLAAAPARVDARALRAEAEELASLADRLLARRELSTEYKEAA